MRAAEAPNRMLVTVVSAITLAAGLFAVAAMDASARQMDGPDVPHTPPMTCTSTRTSTATTTGTPPTATPTPVMLSNVNISGVVAAMGTPVSARILLHPSDGRCPWSAASDASGHFDRTCSDARLGSSVDVWVVGDAHDRWRSSYPVEKGESGPRPIEVRAVLAVVPPRRSSIESGSSCSSGH